MEDSPVDAVVMWVDNRSEEYRREYNKYALAADKEELRAEGSGRHRSNGELKYCLRGIRANMPWIRRVYVVTNGQTPPDIDFDGEKLTLVTHKEFFPSSIALPTFNSFVIDSLVHRIPGLSEEFIRFSDDFLVTAPVEHAWVAGSCGEGRFFFGARVPAPHDLDKSARPYLQTLAVNRDILSRHLRIVGAHNPLHVPQYRHKTHCFALESLLKQELRHSRRQRFRGTTTLNFLYLYPHYVASMVLRQEVRNDDKYAHPDLHYASWKHCRQVQVGSRSDDWKERLDDAISAGVTYINVNDSFGSEPDENDLHFFLSRLEKVLPVPCEHERQPQG